MKIRYFGIAALLAASLPGPAMASPASDELSRCTIAATTAADRVTLMRWMFVVVAANPSIGDLSTIDEATRERAIRAVAAVFDRLLLHDCRRQTVAVMRRDGTSGIEVAFEALGQLAAEEMIGSPQSIAAIGRIDQFMDISGFEALEREVSAPGETTT